MYELPFFATTFPKLTLSNYFEEVHVVKVIEVTQLC